MRIAKAKELERFIRSLVAEEDSSETEDAVFNEYLRLGRKENEAPKRLLLKAAKNLGIDGFDPSSILTKAREIDPEAIRRVPYYSFLVEKEGKHGDILLAERSYKPRELFLADEPDSSFLRAENRYGFFAKRFSYPALTKGGRNWMSLIPHEIASMEKPLEAMEGDILVYGLGLGYFAFASSEKECVRSVTIIENDPSVIELFEKDLLPFFPHKEKIRIIQEDALYFGATIKPGQYDCLFADLWRNEEDGIPLYGRLLAESLPIPTTFYWIEKSMLLFLRRHAINYLLERLEAYPEEAYEEVENLSDYLYASLHEYFRNTTIQSMEDIKEILSERVLKEVLRDAYRD